MLCFIPFVLFSSPEPTVISTYGAFSISFNDPVSGSPVLQTFFAEDDGTGSNQEPKAGDRPKRLGRAVLVNGALWLADSIRYWSTYASWIEDWQFHLTWEDQKDRFFSFKTNRFDSNPFRTNWTHGLGGAVYFNIARYHGLNLFECLLFETASSMIWEYFTEWREVISINDNFFSGLGGVPIGEPFYQLGKYLLSRKGALNQVAGYLLNPVFAISDLFGGKRWRSKFTEEYFSRPVFSLSLGNEKINYGNVSAENTDRLFLKAGSEFFKIPGYAETAPAKITHQLNTTFYSGVEFGISLSDGKAEEINFNTSVIYLGYFSQTFTAKNTAGSEGHSFFIGASSGFSLYKKRAIEYYDGSEYHYDFAGGEEPDQPVNFTDKLAVINLIGPSAELVLYSSPFKLRFRSDITFDFALVNSIALNEYSRHYDIFSPRMKTTLVYYGYYYAFGYTVNFSSRLDMGGLFLEGGVKHQKYGSVQGLDRFQDRILDDSQLNDSRTLLRGGLGYRIPGSGFSILLFFENIKRKGTLNDITVNDNEKRLYSSIGVSF